MGRPGARVPEPGGSIRRVGLSRPLATPAGGCSALRLFAVRPLFPSVSLALGTLDLDSGANVPPQVSVILPCRNESASLAGLLPRIREFMSAAEILVVDDASTDGSADICADHGVRCIRHPYRKGNVGAWDGGAGAVGIDHGAISSPTSPCIQADECSSERSP
jgi:hypothetical protein